MDVQRGWYLSKRNTLCLDIALTFPHSVPPSHVRKRKKMVEETIKVINDQAVLGAIIPNKLVYIDRERERPCSPWSGTIKAKSLGLLFCVTHLLCLYGKQKVRKESMDVHNLHHFWALVDLILAGKKKREMISVLGATLPFPGPWNLKRWTLLVECIIDPWQRGKGSKVRVSDGIERRLKNELLLSQKKKINK